MLTGIDKNTRKTAAVMVIVGATGDLVSKKIVPALFHAYSAKHLPRNFRIIGFARRPFTDAEFQKRVRNILKEHGFRAPQKDVLAFSRIFAYHQGFFDQPKAYEDLKKRLGAIDKKIKAPVNKLFYFAVPPQNYQEILKNLVASGLTKTPGPKKCWTRVLVEKPFGTDYKSSEELDNLLAKLFKEEQIYRIDHYLAKEMLQEILAFRFSNNIFENIWSREFISSIDIRLWESIGVEHRGNFYDKVGALRDVGQNHLLQMLALVAMEKPADFSADSIRLNRNELLKNMKPLSSEELANYTFRAQYKGYKRIEGVDPKSQTETYFKIRAFIDSPRWHDVPVTMESGKRMGRALKEIVVNFRHPTPCLCPPGEHLQNKIVFQIEPEEHIKVQFWSKRPGVAFEIEDRNFDFFLRPGQKRTQYVEEYIKLLLDSINGDQTLFADSNEVKSMWKFIDPIQRSWQKNKVPLAEYKPDTETIAAAADKMLQHGIIAAQAAHPRKIGIIGLGKMGGNLAAQLAGKGWQVVGYNRSLKGREKLRTAGVDLTDSMDKFIEKLGGGKAGVGVKKIVWLMLPAGQPTDDAIFGNSGVLRRMSKGDILIDGANAYYKDTVRRARILSRKGIKFLDAGVSGGPSGALNGACVMIGGDKKVFREVEYLFKEMSVKDGYQFFDGAGAGHFVKMVHNGIEYGMMQAIAEGFNIMKKARFKLDLSKVAEIYNHGSVIESRLIGWLEGAFKDHGHDLKGVSGKVSATGEGAWTVQTAKEMKLKAKIIEESLKFRKTSQKSPDYAGKILSALREQFGGHSVH